MLIDKGIEFYDWNYNLDFFIVNLHLWWYILWKNYLESSKINQLYVALSIWKDLHLGWVEKHITIDF